MAGRPKTRAKRAAAAEADAQGAAPASAGSRARARTDGRTGTRKAPAGGSRRRKAKVRAAFEPATLEDFAAVQTTVEREALKSAKRGDEPDVEPGRGKLTPEDRVERDMAIVAASALSMQPSTIAARFGLTTDHVYAILRGHRERRAARPSPTSAELLNDALDALEAQMERVSVIAGRTGASESAVVGAVRTWKELWLSRLELLQIMGRIDAQPSAEARLARARDMLIRLLAELRERGVAEEVIQEAAAGASIVPGGIASPNVITIESRR